MSRIITGMLAAALTLSLPAVADAANKKKKAVKRQASGQSSSYSGSATERQRANSRAYDRGGYYEEMSEAHVFGSRSWWYLKEREMGGSRN